MQLKIKFHFDDPSITQIQKSSRHSLRNYESNVLTTQEPAYSANITLRASYAQRSAKVYKCTHTSAHSNDMYSCWDGADDRMLTPPEILRCPDADGSTALRSANAEYGSDSTLHTWNY